MIVRDRAICPRIHLILIVLSTFICSCQESEFDEDFLPGDELISEKSAAQVKWDFSRTSDFEFEKNISIIDGHAELGYVDLKHSGDDFLDGSHFGTNLESNKYLTMLTHPIDSSTDIKTIYPSLSENLIGYWRFDDDLEDKSGNGLISQSINSDELSSTRKVGSNSLSAGSSIDVENSSLLQNLSQLSLCYWINPQAFTDWARIVQKSDNSQWTSSSVSFYIQFLNSSNSDVAQFGLRTDEGGVKTLNFPSLSEMIWSHMCAIYDGSSIKVYLNGEKKGETSQSGMVSDFTSSSNTLRIASTPAPSYYLGVDAYLDEFFILNTALSDDEVHLIYEKQQLVFNEYSSSWAENYSHLVAHWKMDGNWRDSSGNAHHAQALGDASFTSLASVKIGSHSGVFDGDEDYIKIDDLSFTNANEISYFAWIKGSESVPSTFNTIAYFKDSRPLFEFNIKSTGQMSVFLNTGSWVGVNMGEIYSDWEAWHHVGFTYDGTSLSVYRDGLLIDETSYITGPLVGTNGLLGIGNRSCCGHYFEGFIDEVIFFNKELGKSDIYNIYHRQKQRFAASYESPIIDMGTEQEIERMSMKTDLPFYKLLNSSIELSSDYTSLNSNLSNELIGYWPLESSYNGISGEVKDFAGSYNGISTGSISSVEGVVGKASYFNNTHGISIAPFPNFNTFSTCFWISSYDISGVNTWAKILSKADGTNGWYIERSSSTMKMHFRTDSDEQINKFYTSYSDVFDGKYHHVCALYNNGAFSSYIDGEADVAGAFPAGLGFTNSAPLRIGLNYNNNRYFSGVVDEVSLWSRILSEDEVKELYQRGGNRIKYQVRQCSDASCSSSPEWKGAGGDATTYFSELFNFDQQSTEEIFSSCYISSFDVCSQGSFSLLKNTRAMSLELSFDNFPLFNKSPLVSRYFQYRVLMESFDNKACAGEVCLPVLNYIDFPTSSFYFGGGPELRSLKPLYVPNEPILVREEKNGGCSIKYQLSVDSILYQYWDGSQWREANSLEQSNSITTISNNITSFTNFPSNLYFKAYFVSNGIQSCSLNEIVIEYLE